MATGRQGLIRPATDTIGGHRTSFSAVQSRCASSESRRGIVEPVARPLRSDHVPSAADA